MPPATNLIEVKGWDESEIGQKYKLTPIKIDKILSI